MFRSGEDPPILKSGFKTFFPETGWRTPNVFGNLSFANLGTMSAMWSMHLSRFLCICTICWCKVINWDAIWFDLLCAKVPTWGKSKEKAQKWSESKKGPKPKTLYFLFLKQLLEDFVWTEKLNFLQLVHRQMRSRGWCIGIECTTISNQHHLFGPLPPLASGIKVKR